MGNRYILSAVVHNNGKYVFHVRIAAQNSPISRNKYDIHVCNAVNKVLQSAVLAVVNRQ